MEREQEKVNSLQNMVVVVDESNENSSDEGNYLHVNLAWFSEFLVYFNSHCKSRNIL